MSLTMTLPTAVYAVWWTVLLAVLVVIVPLAVALLQRTLRAALQIRRYLAEMRDAGGKIAENTTSVPALKQTLGVAETMVRVSGDIDQHSGTIARVLAERATGGSTS